jgi:hypothetical protein
MRKLIPLLGLLVLCVPALAKDKQAQRELADRNAIMDTMHKYIWTVDSLDADGYVSVFTEDAQIDSNGQLMKGHEAIRKVVIGMQAQQAKNRAEGKPVGALYHVVTNERISFTNATEAVYYSYWQTMRKGQDGRYATGGFGRSEDHLVRQKDGSWLIQFRKLTVFTE